MTKHSGRTRVDIVGRIGALGLTLLAAAACDKSSTAPPATATTLAISAGNGQVGTVGAALAAPIVVQILDASGNPLSGVSVGFAPNGPSGSVSATQVTTDANGSAQVSWTLGTVAGADSLVVTAGTLTPVAILATASPGAPASVAIVAGNDQSAAAGTALPSSLTVKVVDQFGNAVPNVMVTWSDDAGGVLANLTTVTDANGFAQNAYTLAPNAGPEDVVATVASGAASPVVASFLENGM